MPISLIKSSFSGLYFDADKKLFYDGQKGLYLEYNTETKNYEPINADPAAQTSSSSESETQEEEPKECISTKQEVKEPRELSEGEGKCFLRNIH